LKAIVAAIAIAAALHALPARAQDGQAPVMTTDQVRELFSSTMEFCIDSFRSQKPFEQMPGLTDRLAKTPVVRQVGAGEPELYEHWHAIGQYAV